MSFKMYNKGVSIKGSRDEKSLAGHQERRVPNSVSCIDINLRMLTQQLNHLLELALDRDV